MATKITSTTDPTTTIASNMLRTSYSKGSGGPGWMERWEAAGPPCCGKLEGVRPSPTIAERPEEARARHARECPSCDWRFIDRIQPNNRLVLGASCAEVAARHLRPTRRIDPYAYDDERGRFCLTALNRRRKPKFAALFSWFNLKKKRGARMELHLPRQVHHYGTAPPERKN